MKQFISFNRAEVSSNWWTFRWFWPPEARRKEQNIELLQYSYRYVTFHIENSARVT